MRCHASAAYSLKLGMALRLLTFLSSVLPNLFSCVSVSSHIPFLAWSQSWLDWIPSHLPCFQYYHCCLTSLSTALYTPFPSLFFSISLFPFSFPLDGKHISRVMYLVCFYRRGNFMHVFSIYILGLFFPIHLSSFFLLICPSITWSSGEYMLPLRSFWSGVDKYECSCSNFNLK